MTRTRWPAERLARAAFLCGKGYPADRIAADALVASSPSHVARHLHDAGMVAREVEADECLVAVPSAVIESLRSAASLRGKTTDELTVGVLQVLAADHVLLANVIDDDIG